METKVRMMVLMAVSLAAVMGTCGATEAPQYAVVHAESDFEIRLYRDSVWMSAPSDELSFAKATLFGFHRSLLELETSLVTLVVVGGACLLPILLFQYIQGANLNCSRIPMTSPVVTSLVQGAGPLHSSAYVVRFYLPAKFQADPPVGLPELDLAPFTWDSQCVAVRKFSGFATDENVVKEAEKLATSLSRTPWANETSAESKSAYSIAQYDPPFRFIGRTNEVWVEINTSEANGCAYAKIAAE